MIPGAQRMVVGHTIQGAGINTACDDRVYRIDVGLSRGCGNGNPEAKLSFIIASHPKFRQKVGYGYEPCHTKCGRKAEAVLLLLDLNLRGCFLIVSPSIVYSRSFEKRNTKCTSQVVNECCMGRSSNLLGNLESLFKNKWLAVQVLEIINDREIRSLREGKEPMDFKTADEDQYVAAAWSWWQKERGKLGVAS